VAPGKYDEFYDFVSGGFSGQMSVYGLPSGRLLRVIPVFSVDPEKGYGYSEEYESHAGTLHMVSFPGMIFTILRYRKQMASRMAAGYLAMATTPRVSQELT
jgi:nitrous oxide reductase